VRNVPIAEFKDKVSEIISAVEAGEEVAITRHGKIAARLLPPEYSAEQRERARRAFARLKQMRDKMRAEGRTATIDEMIAWKNEGRK